MKSLTLLLLALGAFSGSGLHAANRGVWFWGSTTLPGGSPSTHGSIDVVGDPLEELIAVSFMTSYGVKRVYGSYQNRPVSEPGTIAAWNAELHAAGIESQLLIDGTAVNDPAWVADLQVKITERLVDFNTLFASNPAKQFDALHLDLEPQGTTVWDDDATGTVKRALLDDLADTYAAIRTQLDTAGFAAMPIYADIPFFWDKLPADGGSVAWADAADRDNWYANLASSLDGLSIMTFSKTSSASLQTATAFERGGTFPGEVVVGIQPKTGPGQTWADYDAFEAVMLQLESDIGTGEATDLENYAFWRHAVATFIPSLPAAPEVIALPPTGGGPFVVVKAKPGHRYVLQESGRLSQAGRWSDVGEFTCSFPDRVEEFSIPVRFDAGHGFWRLVRRPLP